MKRLFLFLFIIQFLGCASYSRKKEFAELAPPIEETNKVVERVEKVEVPVFANTMLQRIHFDFDKSNIRPDAERILEKNSLALKNHPEIRIEIEGHGDERGNSEYNLALGERRAFAVRNYLVSLGISEDRISTISYGEEYPILDRSDEAAWAINRRAEFVIASEETSY